MWREMETFWFVSVVGSREVTVCAYTGVLSEFSWLIGVCDAHERTSWEGSQIREDMSIL